MLDTYIVEFKFRTAITRIFITDNIYWLWKKNASKI